jgi:excisionase family DNA binding protein
MDKPLRRPATPNEPHSSASQAKPPLLYRDREAARLLGCDRSTIWRLWETGKLSYVRYGRNRRVEASALLRFIEVHRVSDKREGGSAKVPLDLVEDELAADSRSKRTETMLTP